MTTTYVIPCGAAKQSKPARARELYTGSMFKHTLAAALAQDDARVLILSAKYWLVELDTMLDPYDLRMGQEGSVSAATLVEQAQALGLDWTADVFGMLPAAYMRALDALRELDIYVQPVYEAAPGIGHQRHVNSAIS